MAGTPIRFAPGASLAQGLSTLPKEARPYIKRGFVALSKVPEQKFSELFTTVAEQLPAPHLREASFSVIAARLGISEQEVGPLLSTCSIIISVPLARSGEDTAQDFIAAAREVGLLDEAQTTAALAFADVAFQQRSVLKQIVERSRLSAEVLPSFRGFESVVDIRPGFSQGRITFAVPLAMLLLLTDVKDEFIAFQVTKSQLENLIKELQDTLRRVEQAEEWVESLQRKGS